MKCTPQNRITLRASFCGDARELERVAGVVGGVLHLGALVVVREDHDVALGGEAAELLLEVGEVGGVRHEGHYTLPAATQRCQYLRCG